jgi:hypothetical protein
MWLRPKMTAAYRGLPLFPRLALDEDDDDDDADHYHHHHHDHDSILVY